MTRPQGHLWKTVQKTVDKPHGAVWWDLAVGKDLTFYFLHLYVIRLLSRFPLASAIMDGVASGVLEPEIGKPQRRKATAPDILF